MQLFHDYFLNKFLAHFSPKNNQDCIISFSQPDNIINPYQNIYPAIELNNVTPLGFGIRSFIFFLSQYNSPESFRGFNAITVLA